MFNLLYVFYYDKARISVWKTDWLAWNFRKRLKKRNISKNIVSKEATFIFINKFVYVYWKNIEEYFSK